MPSLMFHKLRKTGKNNLIITVPKAWADFYGLKAGDTVEIVVNGVMTVYPKKGMRNG
jgi:AbrB family looped-hinge helix DNA binding protein